MTEEEKAAAEAAARAAEQAAADEAARIAAAAAAGNGEGDDDDDDDVSAASLEEAQAELKRARAELRKANRAAEKAAREADRFKGIDPDKARSDAKAVAEAEKARREAEKRAATASGNFERLREIQNEEHKAQLDAERAAREEAEKRLADLQDKLHQEKRKSAFSGSKFLADETILSGAKADRLYGDHVEIEDGEIVVYDAPRGSSRRVKLMDTKGNPLPFDIAIKKVIEADPDKDTIMRSRLLPGAGSRTEDTKSKNPPAKNRIDRIKAGLKAMQQ